MERTLATGRRAPGFDLRAAGSGRRLTLEGAAGRKLVLVFHGQETAPAARAVNRAVRSRHPSPEEVVVASVVDLSLVPPVFVVSVGYLLESAYREAARELPPGADPADYVLILADWSGRVGRRYGARRTDHRAAVVVIDEASNVAGYYDGGRPTEFVLEILGRPGNPDDGLESGPDAEWNHETPERR